MRLKVYLLLAVAHYMGVEQRQLQKASGLGANTLSVWKTNDRHPTAERFQKAQSALVDLAGLPSWYKDIDIQEIANRLIK